MAKKSTRTAPKTAPKTAKVSAEDFCKAWKKAADVGKTADDLARDLGMTKASVIARKTNYATKLGLKFPKLARKSGARLDKTALQKLLS